MSSPRAPKRLLLVMLLPVLAVLALLGAGCSSGNTQVIITAPEQGGTASPGDVKVSVKVDGFDVVDKSGQANKDGEGHLVFYLDVGQIPTVSGQPANGKQGSSHTQATTDYSWPNVSSGQHTFAVQLVNNDETPLKPPVIAQVTVEVSAGGTGSGTPSPSPSPSSSPSPSPSRSASASATAPAASSSATKSATPTPSPSPTSTPSPTATP